MWKESPLNGVVTPLFSCHLSFLILLSFLSLCLSVPTFQARNIAVCVEFRDSDEEDAQPLKVNYLLTLTNNHEHTQTLFVVCVLLAR